MRLSLSVNNARIARASLEAKGWLSAHISLSNGIDSDEPANRVWLTAADISEEPNAVHSTWEGVALSVGDKIEIEVLPEGDSDPPINLTRTSASPKNLFSNLAQARSLLAAIKVCETTLIQVADAAQSVEPPDDMEKIRIAVGAVLAEMDQQLISPTLRRHPDLSAEAEASHLR